ncbi:hypothetical protein F7018_06860 [Tenacibaculum aiptasiae]|uniref:Lipoprotein n=1 Tax=Tenacibaculum aiptasiae TaxID=426481 RepID=A0A7J5AMS9_9FLAO|nr:hypothetical protein [Tenacibaculum aiptasiae]KAB1158820.1 hypothetical protein F7018_06860 [Tenacibaculum aiptasiae]
MKKLILILLTVGLILSCKPRIENNSKTLDKVFAMSSFDIEIHNWGCFSQSKEHFTVELKNEGYLLQSKRTGKSHLVSKIKMDSLKNFLKTRIGKEDYGGCTSSEYIRLGSIFNSVDYEHSHCSGIEATMINDLLNYYELISENEFKSIFTQ